MAITSGWIFEAASMIILKLPFREKPISLRFGRSSLELTWGDIVALVLSQTRLLIVVLKLFAAHERHKNLIIGWNLALLCCSVAVCALADSLVRGAKEGDVFGPSAVHVSVSSICIFLAYFATARIFEILYAFYKDAMDKVEKKPKRSCLTKKNRLQLLFLSYVELVLNYAIIYYFALRLGWASFSVVFEDISHAIYFSGVTIATVGYGDQYPTSTLARYIVMGEVVSGILLFVVSLAVYLGGDD